MKFLGRQWFKLVLGGTATSERSVVVITGRCQRLNPGSSPGARTIRHTARQFRVYCDSFPSPNDYPMASLILNCEGA